MALQAWQERLKAQGVPEDIYTNHDKAMNYMAGLVTAAEAKLKAEQDRPLKYRLNPDTGTIMLTGLRQFPISLYASEWRKVLDPALVEGIKSYLDTHATAIEAAEVKGKAAKEAAKTAAA